MTVRNNIVEVSLKTPLWYLIASSFTDLLSCYIASVYETRGS